ncbi:hypothetical protein FF098_014905 [Parvularcula flava]|uniref:Uncharacterized protein n=1 Tax=Aquisalinus luteolus TaxID=1566827 RepID=A0A8J3A3Q4_9PROT|nr:hypothetical protein [Aquisalinus luteolus]NHK29208.1 hypothetical protein [Aquisalinus luteolus]GGH99966.1 hypothetical protein GCM10011355_27150 [Aquisalinus luteolus]
MPTPPITDETLQESIDVYIRNGWNTSAAAREIGIDRSSMQHRLRTAQERGLLNMPDREPNPSKHRPFAETKAAQIEQFKRRKMHGTWRNPNRVTLKNDLPFLIIFIGDPHLDNPGTDLELFDKWTEPLCAGAGIYGFALGDWLDNWVRFLKFLYAETTVTEEEGGVLLDGYLEKLAPNLIGSVSGNHDDWSAYLGRKMDSLGVLHRSYGMLLELVTPGRADPIRIGARHRWTGKSIHNNAHGVMRGARAFRDHIVVGGDYHISGSNIVKCPETGRLSHCHQIAAFKIYDDYADENGFTDSHISPAVACLIDPSKPDTDPSMVKSFHDINDALVCLDAARAERSAAA